MTATTDDQTTTAIGCAARDLSASFRGGRTRVSIEARSGTYTDDQLNEVLFGTQLVGCLMVVAGANKDLERIVTDTTPAADEEFEPVTDTSTLDCLGIELQLVIEVGFDNTPPFGIDLQRIINKLRTELTGVATSGFSAMSLEEARKSDRDPRAYLERLFHATIRSTPLVEVVPPGLQPEYWQQFVERFAGDCPCDNPGCSVGLLKALARYDYHGLLDQGISADAADAIVNNQALRYAQNAWNDLPPYMHALVNGETSGYGFGSLGDPDDPLAGLGIVSPFDLGRPRPSRRFARVVPRRWRGVSEPSL